MKSYNIGSRYKIAFDEGDDLISCELVSIDRGFLIFEAESGKKIISRPTSIFYIECA